MAKKPAQLSDSLLSNRPRKGEARAQSEAKAAITQSEQSPRKIQSRRRRSKNTLQLNMKVSPETLDQYINLADDLDLTYGDLLSQLLSSYLVATK